MSDMNEEAPATPLQLLKGKRFSALDHGHVVLMDAMGSDEAVLEAARTSYQQGVKARSDDRTLLRYLMRHRHSTPFECCFLKFHVKLPIFVERQWARHRTAGWNEVSARYSELPEEYFVPEADSIRAQSAANKQGRDAELPESVVEDMRESAATLARGEFAEYHLRLQGGVARELARINLPLSTYTEKVWWIGLHNLLHFLGLRMDAHAQKEIRDYATIMGEQIVKPLFPIIWEAFEDYRLYAMQLSRLEQQVLRRISSFLATARPSQIDFPLKADKISMDVWPEDWRGERCRERDECLVKLTQLGFVED